MRGVNKEMSFIPLFLAQAPVITRICAVQTHASLQYLSDSVVGIATDYGLDD
jgi:hypothetical protein